MINHKSVRETLTARLKDDATILKDFADIAAFGLFMSQTSGPITAPALALLIAKTAGSMVSSSTRVIDRLSADKEAEESVRTLPRTQEYSYDRFRELFYVVCQRAYLETLAQDNSLREWASKRDRAEADPSRLLKSFQEHVAQLQEAEVRFHYSIDPTHRSIPLYSAYSAWLQTALGQFDDAERLEVTRLARAIETSARERLRSYLASPDPTSSWMRNYLALSSFEESELVRAEIGVLRSTLDGWRTEVDGSAQRAEQWSKYRNVLLTLPEQKESMYNEDFGVGRVFVWPEASYHRAGLAGEPDKPDTVADLARLLGALVSTRVNGDDLVVLCGGPGSGKSTLCRVLASELAKDTVVHPVFLKLRRCKETTDLASFIEDSLVREGVINRLSDLHSISNVVLILDGFDELVMASKPRLRHFFVALLDDIRTGPLRNTKVVVSGRDTLFPRGEGLPRGSHVISLCSFDHDRVQEWGGKWRSVHAAGTPGNTFYPEKLIIEHEMLKSPLRQLASWPLTLHLLAKVHTSGLADLSSIQSRQVEKSYLYRALLKETSVRQSEQAVGGGRLEPKQMRSFLRAIAWSMYSRSLDSMSIDEVIPLAREYFPNQDEGALSELTEIAIVNAPEIKSGDETGFEFVHKSFAEYLVAEKMALVIEEVSHRITGIDGEQAWHLSETDATTRTAEILSLRVITAEVQEMLEPMLGTFVQFQRGTKVGEVVSAESRAEGLRRVLLRYHGLYCDFLAGRSAAPVIALSAKSLSCSNPLEAYGMYAVGLVLIGAATSRRLLTEALAVPSGETFNIDPIDGGMWRWLTLIHAAGIQVDEELGSRLYNGTTVSKPSVQESAVGDWDMPIKLALLSKIDGYVSRLVPAIERRHERTREILYAVCIVLILATHRRSKGPRESRPLDSLDSTAHFIEHALIHTSTTHSRLLDQLSAFGFGNAIDRRSESRKQLRSTVRRVSERVMQMSVEEVESAFYMGIESLCGSNPVDFTRQFLDDTATQGRAKERMRRRRDTQEALSFSESGVRSTTDE